MLLQKSQIEFTVSKTGLIPIITQEQQRALPLQRIKRNQIRRFLEVAPISKNTNKASGSTMLELLCSRARGVMSSLSWRTRINTKWGQQIHHAIVPLRQSKRNHEQLWSGDKNQSTPLHPKLCIRQERASESFCHRKINSEAKSSHSCVTKTRAENKKNFRSREMWTEPGWTVRLSPTEDETHSPI
jgi:hypothetical protein